MKRYNSGSISVVTAPTQHPFLPQTCTVLLGRQGATVTTFIAAIAASMAFSFGVAPGAIANPVPSAQSAQGIPIAVSSQEVDTSVSRDYEPATVYLPDPQTQQLVPQSVLVTTDEPAAGAVAQIMHAYQGQDVGIRGYEVTVNNATHEANVNFNINNPRGARVFESLSSANQYSLFEAIRETLLTQPLYSVNDIIFQANGVAFDI